jgi:ATP-dependent protease ClpP protease subunit
MRKWFEIVAAAGERVAEINILDFIGTWGDEFWGDVVTAKSFLEELAKLPESVNTIRVRVNSPGGDVFAAATIANALRDQRMNKKRTVEMRVEGLAASAASVVLMAGDTIEMPDNALLMIHNPWSWTIGDAKDMREAADQLDKIRDTIISTYQWQSPLPAEEIGALMDAVTWMNADEAVERGFATAKVEGLKAAACITPGLAPRLAVPERFAEQVRALVRPEMEAVTVATEPEPTAILPAPAPRAADPAEVVRLCGEAGLDLVFAQNLITEGLAADAVEARVVLERSARVAAESRATEIRALCAKAGQDDLAGEYVAGGMTVEHVRSHLLKITAKLDRVEIDAGLGPDHGARKKAVIDVVAVYAERNRLKN